MALDSTASLSTILTTLEESTLINVKPQMVSVINNLATSSDLPIKTMITGTIGAPALSTDTWATTNTNIQNAKNTIATNLGTLGITANGTTDTLATLASKVTKDANLVTGNILAGKTIYGVAGKTSVVDTASATATAPLIFSGKTAYVNGSLVTGTMADYTSQNRVGSSPWNSGTTLYFPVNDGGYYPGAGASGVCRTDANFIASNIVSGVSIFGLAGSATIASLGGRKFTSGSTTLTLSTENFQYAGNTSTVTLGYLAVSGLTFTPSMILIVCAGIVTFYSAISDGTYAKTAKVLNGPGNSTVTNFYNLKGDVSPAYVNSTGFNLPVWNSTATFNWYAWE